VTVQEEFEKMARSLLFNSEIMRSGRDKCVELRAVATTQPPSVRELLRNQCNLIVVGDKAYISAPLADRLW